MSGYSYTLTKVFKCNSVSNLGLFSRFLPLLGKEWLHRPLSPTESCKSCFNQLTLVGNLVATLHHQVTLCTDHESIRVLFEWENFNIDQCYTNVGMSTPLFKFIQYKHMHLVTEYVQQISSCQYYNMYLFSIQTLTLVSVIRCVDQLRILCIAYNCQVRVSIIVEKLSDTCKISQIDAQQKKSSWLGISKIKLETLHQSDDNLCNNVTQLEIHSCDYIIKPAILCLSVDLQLANVQSSVSPKLNAPRDNLYQLNCATSVDQCTCHMTRSFDNDTSCTVRDNVPRTAKQLISSHQEDDQLLNTALTTITYNKQPPNMPRNAYVAINKYMSCGSKFPLASTCVPHPSHMHGYENATVQHPGDVPALSKGTHNYWDKNYDTCDKQNNDKFISYNQGKDKSSNTQQCKQSRCNGSREVRRHKTNNNRSDRNCDDDNYDKKEGFRPAQLILSNLLVLLIILLLSYLIWLWFPDSFRLQDTTEAHSFNNITFNNRLFNMCSKSMCLVITPGWTNKKCSYNVFKPHSRKSSRVANASTTTQALLQDNLHFNTKVLTSMSPQHQLGVLHKSKLLIIMKRKSHRMLTRNSGIVLSRCIVAAVLNICEKRLKQMPRIKRVIPLLQQIYTFFTNLNDYSLWREPYTFCFTIPISKLQTHMLNHLCLTSILDCKVASCFYGENDKALDQLMNHVYIDDILNQFHTLQCSLFDEILKNPTFSHYLSKPCYIFGPNVLQTKKMCIACTMQSNGSYSISNQYSNVSSNNKYKVDETEYEKNSNTHSSTSGHYENNKDNGSGDFTLTYFLLMLQLHILNEILYYIYTLLIIWCLWHVFRHCNSNLVIVFDISSRERRYPLSRIVLIDNIAFQYYPICMFKLKPRFPCEMVLDYYHGRLNLCTYYELLIINAYSNHFLLQILNIDHNIAYCQAIQHQSMNDHVHFKRQVYNQKTLNHMSVSNIASELPYVPANGYCLQESVVDASGSQHNLLHLTNTIKAVSIENIVDVFRPIGKLASGCTISYYSNQGTDDDKDMSETWQLVIGHSTLYHASGNQELQYEHHDDVIINNANPIINFAVEDLQNIDVFIPPSQGINLDDNQLYDNLVIVSLMTFNAYS